MRLMECSRLFAVGRYARELGDGRSEVAKGGEVP